MGTPLIKSFDEFENARLRDMLYNTLEVLHKTLKYESEDQFKLYVRREIGLLPSEYNDIMGGKLK